METPVEFAVVAEVELWAQSADGRMTIETMGKTARNKNLRAHRDWGMGQSAESMESGLSPYEIKMISLLDWFWWRYVANC
jgi:hypothetical protein